MNTTILIIYLIGFVLALGLSIYQIREEKQLTLLDLPVYVFICLLNWIIAIPFTIIFLLVCLSFLDKIQKECDTFNEYSKMDFNKVILWKKK